MGKTIIFAVIAVSMLIIGSYALAVKPDSPPGLSQDKNEKAPGQWKKTTQYENQREFVRSIHMRILERLQDRNVNPFGLIKLIGELIAGLETAGEYEEDEYEEEEQEEPEEEEQEESEEEY